MDITDDPDDIRPWLAVAAIIVLVLLIGAIIYNFWLAPMIFMEQKNAAQDGVQDTYSWENAKTNYEWFKQQEQDIQAKEKQANNTKAQMARMEEQYNGSPSEWPRDARGDYEDLRTQLVGQQNMHNQLVADYNARANMEHRSLFEDDLPYDLDEKFWVGDGR